MGDPAPPTMPVGSDGEWLLQMSRGTRERAERFYGNQVLDRLNSQMCEFVARQEMVFVATADANGHCDATLRRLGTPRDDAETTENRATIRALLGSGFLNLNPALVTITVSRRDETTTEVTIRGVAKEGLIKQRAGQKAAERVAAALQGYVPLHE